MIERLAEVHHGSFPLILLCLAMAVVGCEFKGDRNGVPPATGAEAVTFWRPSPTLMRVYPSSRFIEVDGRPMVEARVEFVDAMGDTLKVAGDVRLELYAANEAGDAETGDRLFAWQVKLHTLEHQQAHFDHITRAYRFRLGMEPLPQTVTQTILRVTYIGEDGQRLQARALLRPDA